MTRTSTRGFTLVEVMMVVLIIGVLAALATVGVRQYLAAAATAEAKNNIGAISRAAYGAYQRENAQGQVLATGKSSNTLSQLCGSSTAVPAADAAISGRRYQAKTAKGQDYNSGDTVTGWTCLKFTISEPQRYRYKYTKGAKSLTTLKSPAVPSTGFAIEARGNLDGDTVYSGFMMVGNVVKTQVVTATVIAEENPTE